MDKHLNWRDHIKILKTKAKQAINVLKVVSSNEWGADKKTLMHLYWATIRSQIDYGCQIYGSASENQLKALESIQNEALRICSGAFRTSPTESLTAETNQPPLNLRRTELGLRFLFKMQSSSQETEEEEVDEIRGILDQNKNVPCKMRFQDTGRNICEGEITPELRHIPEKPPWKLKEINLCFEGATESKQTSQAILKNNFLEHNSTHDNTSHVYTDGSKMAANVGFAAVFSDKTLRGKLPTQASIFTAELHAILVALREIRKRQFKRWTIYTDSQSTMHEIYKYNPDLPITQ